MQHIESQNSRSGRVGLGSQESNSEQRGLFDDMSRLRTQAAKSQRTAEKNVSSSPQRIPSSPIAGAENSPV